MTPKGVRTGWGWDTNPKARGQRCAGFVGLASIPAVRYDARPDVPPGVGFAMLRFVISLVAVAMGTAALRADEPLPPGALLRLGDTRFLAGGAVARLEFSADGRQLTAWAGAAQAKTVWDTSTWEPFRVRDDVTQTGAVARFQPTSIPDSTRGVVIGEDGVAVIHDYRSGKDVVRLTGHHARASAVTVSPDGKRIATGSADGLVRVWDAETYRPVTTPTGHAAAVVHVEVSPDGRTALTTGRDGAARLWDLSNGRELRAFAAPDGIASFTRDGAAVRLRDGDRLVTRDVVTGLQILRSDAPMVDPFAFPKWLAGYAGLRAVVSTDGRCALVARPSGAVDVIELASGQVRRRLVHPGGCFDLCFTPDGRRLLSAGGDHSALVWGMRLQDVPLAADLKRETNALKLWERVCSADADVAYRAMARLAADPTAAVKIARMRLKTWTAADPVAETRAVELLEALDTADSRAFLKELAAGDPDATRTREAAAALSRAR